MHGGWTCCDRCHAYLHRSHLAIAASVQTVACNLPISSAPVEDPASGDATGVDAMTAGPTASNVRRSHVQLPASALTWLPGQHGPVPAQSVVLMRKTGAGLKHKRRPRTARARLSGKTSARWSWRSANTSLCLAARPRTRSAVISSTILVRPSPLCLQFCATCACCPVAP